MSWIASFGNGTASLALDDILLTCCPRGKYETRVASSTFRITRKSKSKELMVVTTVTWCYMNPEICPPKQFPEVDVAKIERLVVLY